MLDAVQTLAGRILATALVVGALAPSAPTAAQAPRRAALRQLLSGIEDTPTVEDWRRIGDGALPVLLSLFQDPQEPAYVRRRALGATAAFARPAVRTFLLAAGRLEGQHDLFVREAVFALARGFGRRAVGDVASFFGHEAASVREAVAIALGRIGGAEARAAIAARLRVEQDSLVREALERARARSTADPDRAPSAQ